MRDERPLSYYVKLRVPFVNEVKSEILQQNVFFTLFAAKAQEFITTISSNQILYIYIY